MSFAQLQTEHIRRSILLALQGGGNYSHNESVLRAALDQYALTVSRDRLRTELRWLEEQGLISLRDVSGYLVATLTARGEDVCTGAATVPGVKRPSPRG